DEPRRLNRQVPARLEEIIVKALEKDRKFRYQSAVEIRTDVQRLKRENGSESEDSAARFLRNRRAGIEEAGRHWGRRMLWGGVAAVVGIAVLGILRFGPPPP